MVRADGAISHGLDLSDPRGAVRSGLRRAVEANARLHPAAANGPLPRCGRVELRAARPCRPRDSDRNRLCGMVRHRHRRRGTVGIVLYHEPATALRLFFLVTLIGSIIGLKLATPT